MTLSAYGNGKRKINQPSAVAEFGVNPEGCKFAPPVEEVWIEAIEIITCSEIAKASIKGVKYVET